ncbi:C2H2-type domain-containing protein [Madurella fahalii]|uniref:C2H2-type domain-containing protein n=1 Tax=Madurella fahalii TaxID=1157608 RepID=A0ABQ0GCU3_9PEZI
MTGLERPELQSQISALVARGLSSLKTLHAALGDSPAQSSAASSHLARLKLWAGNLGAHRPSRSRSLEYRLRDASSIRNHIISLLTDLCESVDEGLSMAKGDAVASDEELHDATDAELKAYFQDDGDENDSDVGQILNDIRHTIDCLLRLSITIRNPAPHDRFRSRAASDVVELFEQWDIKHVREKFPTIDVKIAERLGRATARRRQYFKYREEHCARLAEGLDADHEHTDGEQEEGSEQDRRSEREKATTVASSIPIHLKDSFSEFAELADDNKSEVSGTSFAPSGGDATHLRVPRVPKEHTDGPFKCPFCCMIISVNTRREWKKHVFRDLQPYVCLSSTCPTPEQQYSRRNDWMNHMRQEHWRFWSCPYGCQQTYSTAQEFQQHVEKSHRSQAAARNLDALQVLSGHPDPKRARGKCPLCLDFHIRSDRQYSSHVADHLESLALFALPHTDEDNSGHDSESSEVDGIPNVADHLESPALPHTDTNEGSSGHDSEGSDVDGTPNVVQENASDVQKDVKDLQDANGEQTGPVISNDIYN